MEKRFLIVYISLIAVFVVCISAAMVLLYREVPHDEITVPSFTEELPIETQAPAPEPVSEPVVEYVAEFAVPQGPFKVKNSSTGKMNTFCQNEDKSLSLKDENGKVLWTVPFAENLCGAVLVIDYYNNGKLQYLFAAGSKLYLIDRLGRMVSGFPVELGKDVKFGPAAVELGGDYTLFFVHADGNFALYDMHGKAKQ